MKQTQTPVDALVFCTRSGQEYLYDDYSGLIFPTNSLILDKLYKPDSTYLGIDRSRPDAVYKDISASDISSYVKRNSFNQLTLEITGACNFRCKYCIYGNHYPATRMFSSRNMDIRTAKKAIDYYMDGVIQKRKINPHAFPTIGFYGGEPLLRFSVIEEIVNYIGGRYSFLPKIVYTITTNGYLLSEPIADFFVEHDFSIIVSLDGDKDNHDRNRITANQSATFYKVYSNIRKFRGKYPDYKKFGISACYDYRTDLFKMRDFFEREELFIVKLSQVSGANTDYYNLFTAEEEKRFREQLEALRQDFFSAAKNGTLAADTFLFPLFGTEYAEFTFHPMIREKRPDFSPYTAACVPGDKIYVTADGKFHICERVPHDMPIGDVDHGLDFQAIADIMTLYNRKVCTDCPSCTISKLCGVCYATVRRDHDFHRMTEYCPAMKEVCKKKMEDLTSLLERNPSLMEQVTVDYYQAVIDKAGYIIE